MEGRSEAPGGRSSRLRATFSAAWPAVLAVYAVGLWTRLPLLGMPIYGDEAVLYYFSRYPLQNPNNVFPLDFDQPPNFGLFFWWRPLFRILLIPGAVFSFEGYRLLHLLVTAALGPVTLLLLRRLGASSWTALLAGLSISVYPTFVHWGVVVFPDSTMVVAFTAALLARAHQRPALAAALLTAAIWLKETAIVGAAVLLAWDFIGSLHNKSTTLRPLRIAPQVRLHLQSIALGLAPLLFYMARGGPQPGWTPGGNGTELLDHLFASLWLAPLALVGLCWRQTRLVSLMAVAYPTFYMVYAWWLDRGVELWYVVQPVHLSLVVAFLVADRLLKSGSPRAFATGRIAGAAILLLVLTVVGVQTLAPAAWPPKDDLTAPISGFQFASLSEVYDRNYGYDPLAELEANLQGDDWRTLFLVDFGWFFIAYPFGANAQTVRFAFTGWEFTAVAEIERWTRIIEGQANATIIHAPATVNPLNEALRIAYADCLFYTNVDYEAYHGQDCGPRLDRVVEEYERLTGRSLQ